MGQRGDTISAQNFDLGDEVEESSPTELTDLLEFYGGGQRNLPAGKARPAKLFLAFVEGMDGLQLRKTYVFPQRKIID